MVSRRVNYDYVRTVKQDLFSLQKPLYVVMGNHDTNYFKGNPERFTKEEQYWLYQSDCCDSAVREGHALYYTPPRSRGHTSLHDLVFCP